MLIQAGPGHEHESNRPRLAKGLGDGRRNDRLSRHQFDAPTFVVESEGFPSDRRIRVLSRLLATKTCPVRSKLAPHLADPSLRYAKLPAQIASLLLAHQRLNHRSFAHRQRLQP